MRAWRRPPRPGSVAASASAKHCGRLCGSGDGIVVQNSPYAPIRMLRDVSSIQKKEEEEEEEHGGQH
jgi:hypothetical protein